MTRMVISNQRGGVAKTTTAVTIASLLASQGKKVLLIDTDPQGSVHTVLGLKPPHDLYDAMIGKLIFTDCLVEARPKLWVLPSSRRTAEAEQMIATQLAREMAFQNFFGPVERTFDVVLIDVAPSISLLQTCAMLYTRNVLVPVAMETLSLQGAISAYHTADMLNRLFPIEPIRVLAFLPVMVNRRLEITKNVTSLLDEAATKFQVPILPSIRTDQEVVKSMRDRRTLLEAYPNSKALEDYRAALTGLLPLYEDSNEQAAGKP